MSDHTTHLGSDETPADVQQFLDDIYAAQQCALSEAELDELWAFEQHRRDTHKLVAASQLAAVAMTINTLTRKGR